MRLLLSLTAFFFLSFTGIAQNSIYIKYLTDIDATSEEGEMMKMMMDESTLEIASNQESIWVQTKMGTMITIIMERDIAKEELTIHMNGLIGSNYYQGNPNEFEEEDSAEKEPKVTFTKEKKKILSYTCKKAIMTDDSGNESIYWYTEKLKRPEFYEQMPEQIPGLCLEMTTTLQDGVTITYEAEKIVKNVDMTEYSISIPEGTNIMSLKDMKDVGMGGM